MQVRYKCTYVIYIFIYIKTVIWGRYGQTVVREIFFFLRILQFKPSREAFGLKRPAIPRTRRRHRSKVVNNNTTPRRRCNNYHIIVILYGGGDVERRVRKIRCLYKHETAKLASDVPYNIIVYYYYYRRRRTLFHSNRIELYTAVYVVYVFYAPRRYNNNNNNNNSNNNNNNNINIINYFINLASTPRGVVRISKIWRSFP